MWYLCTVCHCLYDVWFLTPCFSLLHSVYFKCPTTCITWLIPHIIIWFATASQQCWYMINNVAKCGSMISMSQCVVCRHHQLAKSHILQATLENGTCTQFRCYCYKCSTEKWIYFTTEHYSFALPKVSFLCMVIIFVLWGAWLDF